MKIGSLVFATDQGLGVLAKQFYDAGVVTDVMMLGHGRREEHPEWYPGAGRVNSLRDSNSRARLKEFCLSVDAMLFFETAFDWDLIPYCKAHGRKTCLVPMHECTPDPLPETPDVIISPSALDGRCYPGSRVLTVPAPSDIPWRRRDHAHVFVHNAGHGGLKGRNGTAELIEAWRYVKSPAKLLVRSQDQLDLPPYPELVGRAAYESGTIAYADRKWLYDQGDVFIFPEKFNGLSLPLQEAYAAGMVVMTTDRFPNNEWLPNGPLIPVRSYQKNTIGSRFRTFDEAVLDPRAIAEKVDEYYGKDISLLSCFGEDWARNHSWKELKPKWLEAILQ